MAITKIHPIKSTLKKALTYVLEDNKTREGLLVSSFACSPETADLEFGFTLSHCMEKGNNLAFHLMQSFKPGETDAETAHKIGSELATDLLKGNYEYVLSTHVDKGHIHNHLIFCAANFTDFHKFISNRKTYYQIRKISDRLCEEFGLSVVVPQSERGNSYKEYLSRKEGASWKSRIRKSVEMAIKGSLSFEEFNIKMNMLGMELREGSNLAFRIIGEDRYFKAATLGYKYREFRIKERISLNSEGYNLSVRNSTPKQRSSVRFNNLRLTANTLNYLVDHGIDSYSLLDQRLKERNITLRNIKDKLRVLEKRIYVQSAIAKQLKILEINSQQSALTNSVGSIQVNQALSEAATKYLRDRGINPPYPMSTSIQKDLDSLRNQLDELYKSFSEARTDHKQMQNIRRQVDQAIGRPDEGDLVKNK